VRPFPRATHYPHFLPWWRACSGTPKFTGDSFLSAIVRMVANLRRRV
jgi:hypothetical protein